MENNISCVDYCTGCSACGDICPKKAIYFKKNESGFYYPVIDKTKCVNCGKCLKVCPQLNKKEINSNNQKGFVSYSNNISNYNSSASGGVFSELATYFLKNKGIVYGAAFDGLKVKHIKIKNLGDLERIQRSKYIQSSISGMYLDCKKELDKGNQVLFSGTPCQISALNNFLKREYDNLLTCDIVCHGVPSQDMFDKCIDFENKKRKGKIIKFDFRYKCNKKTSPRNFRLLLNKGGKTKEIIGNYCDFSYTIGFYKYLFFRESCYHCKYANLIRMGDLTLGDYWDVKDKYGKEKGISMVIANTEKGIAYLKKIKDNLFLQEEDMNNIKAGNETFNGPTKEPKIRTKFVELYKEDYIKAIKKYLNVRHQLILNIYYSMPSNFKFFIKKILKKV